MKKIINSIFKISLLLLIFTSFLPSIFPNIWFLDIFSNFKFQLVIITFCLFILNLLTKKSKLAGVLLLLLTLWNASFFLHLYYPSEIAEITKINGTTIVAINLLSSNNESENLIDFIQKNNPDILILLEYNPKWESKLKNLTTGYSFQKTEVRTDNFGIGYFSKIASKTSILNFDNTNIPSIKADIKINDNAITIVATHPFPPVGQARFEARNWHLKNLGRQRHEFSKNTIVVGDLNTSSYSKHFRTFLKATNLRDSRIGYGILPTWPANFIFLQTTLDHFLISNNIEVVKRKTGKNIGSDHLPILMEFIISP